MVLRPYSHVRVKFLWQERNQPSTNTTSRIEIHKVHWLSGSTVKLIRISN